MKSGHKWSFDDAKRGNCPFSHWVKKWEVVRIPQVKAVEDRRFLWYKGGIDFFV